MSPIKIQLALEAVRRGDFSRLPLLIAILKTALRESSGPCSPIIIRAVQQVCIPLGAVVVPPCNYRVIAMAWLRRLEALYRLHGGTAAKAAIGSQKTNPEILTSVQPAVLEAEPQPQPQPAQNEANSPQRTNPEIPASQDFLSDRSEAPAAVAGSLQPETQTTVGTSQTGSGTESEGLVVDLPGASDAKPPMKLTRRGRRLGRPRKSYWDIIRERQ